MDDLRRLVESDAIKRLQARYQRCVDTKNWEELETCFTEDATSEYDGGKYSFGPRAKIIEFLSTSMAEIVTIHQVHTPEIDILSETEARATWYLQDVVIDPKKKRQLLGAGFYDNTYIKHDGEWKIRKIGYERTFEIWQGADEKAFYQLTHRWDF